MGSETTGGEDEEVGSLNGLSHEIVGSSGLMDSVFGFAKSRGGEGSSLNRDCPRVAVVVIDAVGFSGFAGFDSSPVSNVEIFGLVSSRLSFLMATSFAGFVRCFVVDGCAFSSIDFRFFGLTFRLSGCSSTSMVARCMRSRRSSGLLSKTGEQESPGDRDEEERLSREGVGEIEGFRARGVRST